jgi:tetratricopeptide (TPR) repeat protein
MAKICPDHKLEAAQNLFDANPDEGLEMLQALVRQYPSDLDVRFSIGRAYLETSEADEALEHLEFVVDRKKTANTLSLLAACYAMLGLEFTAQITARKALERGAYIRPALLELEIRQPQGVREKDMFEFERARWQISSGKLHPALATLKRFNDRYPGFPPSLNTFSSGQYQAAAFESSRQVALEVLAFDADNVHAIKNLVWVDLITYGLERARAWREPLLRTNPTQPGEFMAKMQSLVLLEEWTAAPEVMQAFEAFNPGQDRSVPPQIADLMIHYHDEALRALGQFQAKDEDKPQALQDLQALEAQLTVGREPVISLDDLLPMAFGKRWTTPNKRLDKIVAEDLRQIPGWLSFAPKQFGFLAPNSIRCIAAPLLEMNLPVPAPHTSWFEVLRSVALEGPGHVSSRLALLQVLTDHDERPADQQDTTQRPGESQTGESQTHKTLPANSGILIPGWPHREAPIRISTNPDDRPIPTGEAMRQHSQAVALTHEKKYEQARKLYTRLFQEHPENFMIEFNLGGCEYHLPHQREQGIERVKKVHLEHPNYLQARASLAGIYREQDNLDAARELLIWPDLDVAGEHDYAQMTGMLGLIWLEQEHNITDVIKLDRLLQRIAPERQIVLLFKQQLMTQVLETMESIRGGFDEDWDDDDDDWDDDDAPSTLEDALAKVIDLPRRTNG